VIILRENQKPPQEHWRFWSIIAGRGFGKTLSGAHCIINFIKNKTKKSIGIIGHTVPDIKNVMVYGPSGIIPLAHSYGLNYKINWSQYTISMDDAIIYIFSGDYYDKLRGFQLDCVWIDELAKFHNPQELINQVIFASRLGDPQFIITTTPRPLSVFEFLKNQKFSFMTHGSSYDNHCLPPAYKDLIDQWAMTPLGQQEIFGKILSNNPSPWANYRFKYQQPVLNNYILSIDPAVTNTGHMTGIILASYDYSQDKIIIVDDFSVETSLDNWINYVVQLIQEYTIETIVIETNQGGDLLEYSINKTLDKKINIHKFFARHNKYSRSLSTAQLYWQNFIFHYKPLPSLEKQLLEFSGTLDRLDALVWAVEFFIQKPTKDIYFFGL
jgi:phage terminase large subunit-like protein